MKLPSNYNLAAICAGIGASLYSIGSIATLLASLNLPVIPIQAANPLDAFLLIIIAAVFVEAVKHLLEGRRDGYAFLVVGIILAGLLFVLQFVILSTNAIGWLLQLDDWLAWNFVDDLKPQLWLFPLMLPILGFPWIVDYGNNMKNNGGVNSD